MSTVLVIYLCIKIFFPLTTIEMKQNCVYFPHGGIGPTAFLVEVWNKSTIGLRKTLYVTINFADTSQWPEMDVQDSTQAQF